MILKKTIVPILIFFAAIAVFTAGENSLEFIKIDCRFAIFAREMMQRGISFFPTLYGNPYPDYPALQTILIYLASLPCGKVTMFTASLPSAVAAALTLVLIYLTGSLHSLRTGVLAMLFAMSTYYFIYAGRTPSPDIFPALATAFIFYLLSKEGAGRLSWKTGILSVLGLLLAFAFRGPLGLIVPAGVIFAFYAVNMEFRKAVLSLLISGVTMGLCMTVLYFAALEQGGAALTDAVLHSQAGGRMGSQKSFFYYFYKGFGVYSLSYTAALFVVIVLFRRLISFKDNNEDLKFLRNLLAWVLVVIAGLSIPGTKHTRYILPAMPALALMSAFIFQNTFKSRILDAGSKVLNVIFALMPPLLAVLVLTAGIFLRKTMPFNWGTGFFLLSVISISMFLMLRKLSSSEDRTIIRFSHAVLCIIVVIICVAEPLGQWFEESAVFTASVEKERLKNGGRLFFYQIGPDGEDIKYMANLEKIPEVNFISSEKDINIMQHGDILIRRAQKSEFAEAWNFKKIHSGQMGHKTFEAFVFLSKKLSEKNGVGK